MAPLMTRHLYKANDDFSSISNTIKIGENNFSAKLTLGNNSGDCSSAIATYLYKPDESSPSYKISSFTMEAMIKKISVDSSTGKYVGTLKI